MSHSTVAVLVPKADVKDSYAHLEALVADALAPFDENIVSDPYEEKCYCVGLQAAKECNLKAEEQYGSIDDKRKQFWAERAESKTKMSDKESDTKWQELIEPFVSGKMLLLEQHRLKDSPAPGCTECSGTGIRLSTYNAKSKWDWYQIGGRWDGEWPEYKGIKNVTELKNLTKKDSAPFAILTPDDVWHQKGDMGWFGVVANEADADTWESIVAVCVDQYKKDYVAIMVDVHI